MATPSSIDGSSNASRGFAGLASLVSVLPEAPSAPPGPADQSDLQAAPSVRETPRVTETPRDDVPARRRPVDIPPSHREPILTTTGLVFVLVLGVIGVVVYLGNTVSFGPTAQSRPHYAPTPSSTPPEQEAYAPPAPKPYVQGCSVLMLSGAF